MRTKSGLATSLAATIALGVAVLGHPGTGWAQAETMTPELKALIAAADKEGTLLVKWSNGSAGGEQGAKLYEAHMNEVFGSHIKVRWTPGGDMPTIGNEIAIAFKNNQPSPSDIYIGFSRNMAVLNKQDMFQTGDYTKYSPDRLNSDVVERDTFVKWYSATVGFTYNKNAAPSVPERLTDLLKPEWKGKVGTTPFGAGFDMLSAKEAMGPDKAIAFATEFSKQLAGFMLCQEVDRLASGEFSVFATDCSGGLWQTAIDKGAPLVRVLAPDVPIVSYFYLAVPKNATNPNAAKLFITYALSKRGQQDQYEMSKSDLHLFPETHAAAEIKTAEQKYGIHFASADVKWQETANDEGNAAQQKIVKIIQEGRPH